MSARVLVIAAHFDDESFGMLGTILKHKEAGDEVGCLWFSHARDTRSGAEQLCEYLTPGYFGDYMNLKDQEFSTYPLPLLIECIENKMKVFKPTIVYAPFIADLNSDHRVTSEAAMVACRPCRYKGQFWMYSIPGTTELGLRDFRKDRKEKINRTTKIQLLKQFYPGELINGREEDKIRGAEFFERWPR